MRVVLFFYQSLCFQFLCRLSRPVALSIVELQKVSDQVYQWKFSPVRLRVYRNSDDLAAPSGLQATNKFMATPGVRNMEIVESYLAVFKDQLSPEALASRLAWKKSWKVPPIQGKALALSRWGLRP